MTAKPYGPMAPDGSFYITLTDGNGTLVTAEAPSGAAGGDLGGTYPNPTALKTNGTSFGTLATLTPGTGVATALAINIGTAGAPVVLNGAGGTPSSITLTNASGTAASLTAGAVTTNANLTGAVTSVGNATSLGSFSSANLASALTDETGTGANVFAGSPTFTGTAAFANTTNSGTLAVTSTSTFTGAVGVGGANLAGALSLSSVSGPGLVFQHTSGGSANKAVVITYDGAINLSQPGLIIQNISDAGAFVSNSGVLWRDGAASFGNIVYPGAAGTVSATAFSSTTAPTAVSGAGPFLVGSASTLNSRMKIKLNGTDYWLPCSTTAF